MDPKSIVSKQKCVDNIENDHLYPNKNVFIYIERPFATKQKYIDYIEKCAFDHKQKCIDYIEKLPHGPTKIYRLYRKKDHLWSLQRNC